jgi:hypothetical protein
LEKYHDLEEYAVVQEPLKKPQFLLIKLEIHCSSLVVTKKYLRTEKSILRTFYEFSDESGCLADQGFAFQKFFSLLILLHLSGIRPIRLSNVAAENTASDDFFFKAFQEFPGILPHFYVGLFPNVVPAKNQSDGCKTSYDSAADFPAASQSPAEGIQSLDHIVILFSEFFLRNRKNGLASMKAFHEEIHGLFLYLQSSHLSPSYCDRRLFS